MASTDPDAFVIRRTFNAPRELVFETMTQTEHLLQWWGPKECTITVDRNVPRPGGSFLYCMRQAGGDEMRGRFDWHEVEPHSRLVYVSGFADAQGEFTRHPGAPHFPLQLLNTVTLEDAGDGRTSLTLSAIPVNASEEELAAFRGMFHSMEGGFGGMYDLYERYLATADTAQREIVLRRTLNAPRELVFDAFTDPEHIAQWWGPRGFTTTMRSMDVRPGGAWRFDMHGWGKDFPNRIDYLYIERPSMLIYRHGDDSGGPSPHDFLVTVSFGDAGEGRTALEMRSVFPTPEALEAVRQFGAVEGGQQTIDRLEEYLEGKQ